jgi:hypothetical protein
MTARLMVEMLTALASEVLYSAPQLMHWFWQTNITFKVSLKCRSLRFGPHCSTKTALLDGTINCVFIMWKQYSSFIAYILEPVR